MKFGKRLSRELYAPWQPQYINYKLLKKCISRIALVEQEDNFLDLLMEQLETVNCFYADQLAHLQEALNTAKQSSDLIAFQETAALLRQYSLLNYLALYKSIKKYNKRVGQYETPIDFNPIVSSQLFFVDQTLGEMVHRAEIEGFKRLAANNPPPANTPLPTEELNTLSCSSCHKVCKDPVMLSCGDQFCFQCISSQMMQAPCHEFHSSIQSKSFFDCPGCRKVVESPDQLKSNSIYAQFVSQFQQPDPNRIASAKAQRAAQYIFSQLSGDRSATYNCMVDQELLPTPDDDDIGSIPMDGKLRGCYTKQASLLPFMSPLSGTPKYHQSGPDTPDTIPEDGIFKHQYSPDSPDVPPEERLAHCQHPSAKFHQSGPDSPDTPPQDSFHLFATSSACGSPLVDHSGPDTPDTPPTDAFFCTASGSAPPLVDHSGPDSPDTPPNDSLFSTACSSPEVEHAGPDTPDTPPGDYFASTVTVLNSSPVVQDSFNSFRKSAIVFVCLFLLFEIFFRQELVNMGFQLIYQLHSPKGTWLHDVMQFLSIFGDKYYTCALVASFELMGVFPKNASLFACFNLFVNGFFKTVAAAPRPLWVDPSEDRFTLPCEKSFGSPSCHSQLVAGTMLFLMYSQQPNNQKGVWWLKRSIGFAIIAGCGISRIFLGAHFPSQVILGWMGGLATCQLFLLIQKMNGLRIIFEQSLQRMLLCTLSVISLAVIVQTIQTAIMSPTTLAFYIDNAANTCGLDYGSVFTVGGRNTMTMSSTQLLLSWILSKVATPSSALYFSREQVQKRPIRAVGMMLVFMTTLMFVRYVKHAVPKSTFFLFRYFSIGFLPSMVLLSLSVAITCPQAIKTLIKSKTA